MTDHHRSVPRRRSTRRCATSSTPNSASTSSTSAWSTTFASTTADDGAIVTLDMTLTSAACPLTDVIEDQAHSALTGGPTPLAADMKINWVWMPPWGPDKITDEGREQLRALGFNV